MYCRYVLFKFHPQLHSESFYPPLLLFVFKFLTKDEKPAKEGVATLSCLLYIVMQSAAFIDAGHDYQSFHS